MWGGRAPRSGITVLDANGQETAVVFGRPLLLSRNRLSLAFWGGRLGRFFLFVMTAVSVAAVFLIFFFIFREAWPFLARRGVGELLGSARWFPEGTPPEFGALALVFGSLLVTVGAMLIAAPFGLVTAAFLSDIVPFSARQVIKPVIELLAAIPSVAYGFFAIMIFAPFLQRHLGMATGANALNASILLAFMALPTIVSVAEDAMMAVGADLRAASYALGATRAETVLRTVLPAAHNGIIAAVILGIMRAVGETMTVWMASGNASQVPTPWWDLTQPVRTLTATIAGDMGEAVKGGDHYRSLFTLGLALLVFTFVLNLITEFLLRRVRRSGGGMRL